MPAARRFPPPWVIDENPSPVGAFHEALIDFRHRTALRH